MAVEVKAEGQFGVPRPLFTVRLPTGESQFDVSKDGRWTFPKVIEPRRLSRLVRACGVFTQHGIEPWDDEKIPGGWRWEREIDLAIHRARLAVILLTKEALESEFILERELA